MSNRKYGISVVTLLLISSLPALAQASTFDDIFSTNTSSVFLARVNRFFSVGRLSRAQASIPIVNGLLTEVASGTMSTNDVSAELRDFKSERASLIAQVDTLLNTSKNHATIQLTRDVVSDLTAQFEILSQLKSGTAAERTLLEEESVKHLNRILDKTALSEEERTIEVATIAGKASESANTPEKKVARKLELTNDLTDGARSDSVKKTLMNQQDVEIIKASKLSNSQITGLLTLIENEKPEHNIVVLQKLLALVPETAKSGIQTALSAAAEKEVAEVEKDDTELEKISDNDHLSVKVRTDVLNTLKGKAKGEATKKLITQATDDSLKKDEAEQATQASSVPTQSSATGSTSGSGSSDSGKTSSTPSATSLSTKTPSPSPTSTETPRPSATSTPVTTSSSTPKSSSTPSPTPSPTSTSGGGSGSGH